MSEVITEREIKILEFAEIRRMLAELTASPMGREKAVNLHPSALEGEVQALQAETGEGRMLCARHAFVPPRVEDIGLSVNRALKGAMLSGAELASLQVFLKAIHRWQNYFKNDEEADLYPLMGQKVALLARCDHLYTALERAIDRDGEVLDGASSTLSSLRRKKASLQAKIRDKLDEYIRGSQYRRYLQEALVTIRGGRFVIPVKQEYRQNISGVVHDQSASGATLFVEPMAVVQMQNTLTGITRQEEQEIERILLQLSGEVAAEHENLLRSREIYGELDLVASRGRFSLEYRGVAPVVLTGDDRSFILEGAVHPLLAGEKIPLQVELGKEVQTLVITGPNTGGKTVALKTIGLLAIMAQCGLHLPAEAQTKITVFEKIRADIGDEQSIAQSLSTFSGHMKNIIAIVEECGAGDLVLLDELGAGTDPSEGAALAMAILETLTRKGALTVATTHINELKLFAQVQEKMQNGAMEFDTATLAPTYRLLQGVPGQSNAFHIAGQLGLPARVLEKARGFMHRSHDEVEEIISSLVQDQQRYSKDSRQAALDRSRAEMIIADLEKERSLLKARREDMINQAREEARQLVKRTKSAADGLIKELQEIKSKDVEQPGVKAEQIRERLHQLRKESDFHEEEITKTRALSLEELSVGRKVYVRSLKQEGEILSFNENEALIQIGALKVHLSVGELSAAEEKGKHGHEADPKARVGGYSVQKDAAVGRSIDLRGMNLEEAVPLVDKLLDDALWAGLGRVDVIHGKGTGKLKQGLRLYLDQHRLVSDYRSGVAAEGGEGVTVVEIKG